MNVAKIWARGLIFLAGDRVQLAVAAHIRHVGTGYDRLLARGMDRWDARERVSQDVDRVLRRWRG